ncbi:ferrous iron transport protein A [bacterium]|nr:ferrous iron transport protein A [bacterium]MBU1991242.1 ferrous iron transport protein A [bacterium]
MCLLEIKAGEMVSIDSINVSKELRRRFHSLGLMKDTPICIKQFGLFKSTVQIMVYRSLIALRRDEAKLIEVHKI